MKRPGQQAKKGSRRCSKCGSGEVLAVKGSPAFTGRTVMSRVPIEQQVCAECGYAESWVAPEELAKLKERQRKRAG